MDYCATILKDKRQTSASFLIVFIVPFPCISFIIWLGTTLSSTPRSAISLLLEGKSFKAGLHESSVGVSYPLGIHKFFFFCFLCCLCWSLLKSRQTHEGLYLLPSLGIPWSFSCLHVHIVRLNLLHEVRRTLITARGSTARQSQERMTSWRLGANDYWNKFEQNSNWQSVPIALVNLEWINYRTIFYFKEYCPHFSGISKSRLLAYDERGRLYCTFLNKY